MLLLKKLKQYKNPSNTSKNNDWFQSLNFIAFTNIYIFQIIHSSFLCIAFTNISDSLSAKIVNYSSIFLILHEYIYIYIQIYLFTSLYIIIYMLCVWCICLCIHMYTIQNEWIEWSIFFFLQIHLWLYCIYSRHRYFTRILCVFVSLMQAIIQYSKEMHPFSMYIFYSERYSKDFNEEFSQYTSITW